jgi:AsmA family protein
MRRAIRILFTFLGLFLLSSVLYLLFGDLGRHKARIESFVTKHTGRVFVIDGAFELKLYPTVTLLAERARFANAEWGSKPQMVQVEHLSAQVGFWSLISGPIDVRSFELDDVVVLLERRRNGKANWMLGEPSEDKEDETEPKTRTQFPLVIEKAKLTDVRVTYRASGKPDMVARLDSLTIAPGKDDLLALVGSGKLDQYPISLNGEAGPVAALLAGRNIRMDWKGTLGRLALDVDGSFGDLDPLDGANLKVKATGQDVDAMLAKLNLPVIASGALAIDAQLKDAGKRTEFVLDASVGDLSLKSHGNLSGLYLRGSDLNFEASAADAARLAGVFGIKGVPAAPLAVSGHVTPTRKEIRFEALKAQLAGLSAQVDGAFTRGRRPAIAMHFTAGVENLANLHDGLPQSGITARGNLTLDQEKLAVSELTAELGENQLNGSFSMTRAEPRHIEAELTSPRFDLTPFFPTPPAAAPTAQPASTAKQPKDKLLFSDTALPILQLKGTEARLHVAVAELALANKTLKDVDGTLTIDRAHVTLNARGRGSLEGAMETSLTVEPVGTDSANVNLKFALENVRAGLDMKEMKLDEVPPLGVIIELASHGNSTRQMAANSNGHILVTQGAGKTKAAFLGAVGGDVINQLRGKLNPFREQDPFTKLECTVVRADITDGAVSVQPVLMQTQKVTVVAKGKVDLHNEHITFDFDTRPRKGIGVSPGMFTTPFIRLEGTLMNPRIAMGAKGVTSGAVAAATGGLSVLAGGFIDRLKGEANMCRSALKKATEPKPD